MPQPFSALYDLVLPYLPGAEKPIVDSSIRKAARDFLRRTTLIREKFEFDTQVGVDRYQLNAATGQVASVIVVYEKGVDRPMPVATELSRLRPRQQLSWYSPMPTVLAFHPAPDKVITIQLEAAITLAQAAVVLPDGIVDNYGEVLASGAMALMYAMPGKPWTSKEGASVAGGAFGREIKNIRGRLRDGGQPNQSTFTPTRRFGA